MFQGKSFNKTQDFTKKELEYMIDFAIHLKKLKKNHIPHEYMKGQNICLLFDKTSTRTRAAFTVAANDLGAAPEFLGQNDIQFGKKESNEDSAIVLGSMFDGIEMRVSSQELVNDFVKYAGVPIWNGMTDDWHPTQMIADYMTLKEEFGKLEGLTLVYCGDGRNNVANSLLITGAILGVNVTIAAPETLQPSPEVMKEAQKHAIQSGAKLLATTDIQAAVRQADALYTDVWASMGEESQFEERIKQLMPYQINDDLVSKIEGEFIFLHCLPAFHDTQTRIGADIAEKYGVEEMEVSDSIFKSKHARQFEQAENRMHSIKAIMALTNGHIYVPDLNK